MTLCYYCMGKLPNLPWYHRDSHLGKSVKICDKCYQKFDEARAMKGKETLKRSIRTTLEICETEYALATGDKERTDLLLVLEHIRKATDILER